MKIFDTKTLQAFPFSEMQRNVFFQVDEFSYHGWQPTDHAAAFIAVRWFKIDVIFVFAGGILLWTGLIVMHIV